MYSIVAFNLKGAEDRAQACAAMIADLPRARALFAANRFSFHCWPRPDPFIGNLDDSTEEGEFKIDAFELGNIIVGGLFAVIALNFTINAAYSSVATGDNTVTRLFGLNNVALGVGLAIVVLMYRYNFPMRLFGRYVQEQMFSYLSWAVPLLAVGTALAFILVAGS